MKNQKILIALLALLFCFPLVSSAVVNVTPVTNVLNNVIQAAGLIVAVICSLMIIWGGIMMLTAGGDSGKIGTGKQIIIWAAAGLIIVLMAEAITTVIQSVASQA